MQDTHISLAHGNGGRFMRELIGDVFVRHLANPLLNTRLDAVPIPIPKGCDEIMVTTDGFTVQPMEFSGGNLGSLAVHGTVNDLAVSGAIPCYLILNCFIEEGLEVVVLERIVMAMAQAAREAGVVVVAGDTKVVPRGEGSGVYFATTGIGWRDPRAHLGMERIHAGDQVLVSGPIGDHGTAVLLAREEFGLYGELQSDTASVLPITRSLLNVPGLRFMRDPTRGGLATVAHELCHTTGLTIRLREVAIPVRDSVRAVCEILGYDPLFLACEGRVVAVVAEESTPAALTAINEATGGGAALIGTCHAGQPWVILETELGGERILEELEDDPLPRIC
ncbi:Carbamoyl dehydratase HypE [Gammaproteobacteria bacterium]